MTTTQRPRPSRGPAPAPNPASRGVILVVVAVVLGVILLVQGGGVGFDEPTDELEIDSGATPEGGEVEAPPTTAEAEPTSTSVPPAALQVVALNAAGVSGFAAQAQQFLNVAGYTATDVGNAATQSDSTVVYFAPGYEVDAATVAGLLGLELADIAALPEGESLAADPAELPADTNVVVVLGPDVAQVIEGPPADDATGDTTDDTTGETAD